MSDRSRQNKQRGFTLIEIIVVVAIIAIFASIISVNVLDHLDNAKIVKAKQDIQTIETALNLYRLDKHKYPDTDQGLEVLKGKHLKKIPKDPWGGGEYLYMHPGENGEFDLFTYGADGSSGGDGVDADIGNWNL